MPPQEKLTPEVVVSHTLDPTDEEEEDAAAAAAPKAGAKAKGTGRSKDKDVDFDDLLPYIGEFGTYQRILFCLMIPFAFYVAWVYFSQIFITLVPEEHWCRVPELEGLDVEKRSVDETLDCGG